VLPENVRELLSKSQQQRPLAGEVRGTVSLEDAQLLE